MMKNWKNALVNPEATIRQTIASIDSSALQIALVVDEGRRLLGTVTDGDIRRAILKGVSLEASVRDVMNGRPTCARMGQNQQAILATMRQTNIRRIPILDASGTVVDLALLDDLIRPHDLDNLVILMAGGLGARLGPLTATVPKPLLKVGDRPLLETIITGLRDQGFRRFVISVNYMGEMIKDYCGDGSAWDVAIEYIEENKRMGTAGSLGLLPIRPHKPFIVMNSDLLTKVNFRHLLSFHEEHQSQATMCVREYDIQVPYGVVKLDDFRITGIEEKPAHTFFVNAGIYVLDPAVLDLIDHDRYVDMTTLFEKFIALGEVPTAFPIREYWMDIGRIDDFEQAQAEYPGMFAND